MASSYNTSSAYDLSVYEAGRPINSSSERYKVVKTPKQFVASLITPKTVCFFAMAVTVICLMVYNNVCLNEVTGEINELAREMAEMKNENVKMQSELKSIISPRSVAEYAEHELGLKKMDKYQTEYIYLNHEDKIELTNASPKAGFIEGAKHTFNSAINVIKEYIAGW